MAHHHPEESENRQYDYLYYLIGLLSGLFTGAILDVGLIYTLVGGVLGLLTAAFYLVVMVKGREGA